MLAGPLAKDIVLACLHGEDELDTSTESIKGFQ